MFTGKQNEGSGGCEFLMEEGVEGERGEVVRSLRENFHLKLRPTLRKCICERREGEKNQ